MSLRGCGRSLAICSSSSRYVLWGDSRESTYWNTRTGKVHRNHIDWKINYFILPATHFAVHDSGCAEMCQQVIHHVIILLIHLHHTMICWNKWPQSVLHQLEVAFSLSLAKLLQQCSEIPNTKASCGPSKKMITVKRKSKCNIGDLRNKPACPTT